MKRSKRRHQVRNIIATATSSGWAILPEKLDRISEFLSLRSAGYELSPAEIAAAMGDVDEMDQRPRPYIVAGVAVLPLYGTLAPRMNAVMQASGGTSTQEFGSWYLAALANPSVRAILVDADTPGGLVTGIQELADLIYAGRGQKPSVTIANMECCSGGIWVGTATDRFVVSPSSRVGSVGVLYMHAEQSKADEAMGIKRTLERIPQFKAEMNPFEPLSADARAHMREKCEADYAKFLAALSRNRGMATEAVHANFGQGQVLFADQAVMAGMADRIATIEEILGELQGSNSPATSISSGSRSSAGLAAAITTVTPLLKEPHAMGWEKLREALVARGLCLATAGEAHVRATVNALAAAHGQSLATDDAGMAFLGGLPVPAAAAPAGAAAAAQPAGANPAAAPTGAAVVTAPAAHPIVATPQASPSAGQDPSALVLNERQRIRDIRARGQLLGIEAAAIETVIDSGVTLETACERFTSQLASTHQPVQTTPGSGSGVGGAPAGVGGFQVQGSAFDNLVAGASEALYARMCAQDQRHAGREAPQLSANARQFERMGFLQVAQATISLMGQRPHMMDPHDVALAFLGSAGTNLVPMAASLTPGNAPANYPNLLSALANKVMDKATEFAEATYQRWCYLMDPVADFKPQTFIQMGAMGELPFHKDGDRFDEGQFTEEASWISVDSFGRELKCTPMMVVNNNMSSFQEMFEDTMIDHELTVNRLAVDLLTGNPTLPDSVALFHATHGNLIDTGSGGAPSSAQASIGRKLMRKQLMPGGKRKLRLGPAIALVPSDLETVAEQSFSPVTMIPVTDATTNVFKGKIEPIVEPMLDDFSAAVWFMLALASRSKTIVVAFQQGFQGGGKRMTYFKPDNQSQIFQIEGRFGAAVRSYRGAVKNVGA